MFMPIKYIIFISVTALERPKSGSKLQGMWIRCELSEVIKVNGLMSAQILVYTQVIMGMARETAFFKFKAKCLGNCWPECTNVPSQMPHWEKQDSKTPLGNKLHIATWIIPFINHMVLSPNKVLHTINRRCCNKQNRLSHYS